MEIKPFVSEGFVNAQEQTDMVIEWQSRYFGLVRRLGSLGSEVRIIRVFETDKTISPHHFIVDAYHEFIFPKQITTLGLDESKFLDPPLNLRRREDKTFEFDKSLARGHIKIQYDDSESKISFTFTDILNNSELPVDAVNVIEHVISPY